MEKFIDKYMKEIKQQIIDDGGEIISDFKQSDKTRDLTYSLDGSCEKITFNFEVEDNNQIKITKGQFLYYTECELHDMEVEK